MKFTVEQKYLYFSRSGLIYYFYSEKDQLYLKTLKGTHEYSNEKIIEDVIDYSIAIDDSRTLHLVSLTTSGELKYCIFRNEQWICRLLTKYDAVSYRFKSLKIFVVDHKIHILIAMSNIVNPNLWTIKHHFWNNHTWLNNKVCDIVIEKYDLPYQVDIDPQNNIHMVFKSLSEKRYQLYYCRYHAAYNVWNLPVKISNYSQDISYPFIICDRMNGAHLVWSSFSNNNMKIFYSFNSRIDHSRSQWSEQEQLTEENGYHTHPVVLQTDNYIKVIWRQDKNYFLKSKNLADNIWSDTMKIEINDHIKLTPVCIIGDQYKSWDYIKAPLIYGFLGYDIYAVGLDEHPPDFENETEEVPIKNMNPHTIEKSLEARPEKNIDVDNSTNLHESEKIDEVLENEKEKPQRKIERISIQQIYQEQVEIRNLLKKITIEQEKNQKSLEKITDLLNHFNEKCLSEDNSFFSRLKNYFS